MPETVRIIGYREAIRDLKNVDKGTARAIRAGLRAAAGPIVEDTRGRLSKFPGVSLGTIGVGVTATGVKVTQRKKKVTGKRPDFGSLQMREGLVPAAEANEGAAVRHVQAEVDKLIRRTGLQ